MALFLTLGSGFYVMSYLLSAVIGVFHPGVAVDKAEYERHLRWRG